MASRTAVLDPTVAGAAGAPLDSIGEAARRLLGVGEGAAEQITPVDWDDLMRRHGRRVVVSLLARGVAPERAKDLAQEAWFRVIQGYRTGRITELKVPGIVIAQANYLALDDRRRRERRTALGGPNERSAGMTDTADDKHLEQQVAARDQLRRIMSVVERAHPNAQKVFHALYGGDARPAAEIAEELGLSAQRVRQITCELRQRIRRELKGVRRG